MKTYAKRSLAIFLSILMLVSVMAVGTFSASAASQFTVGDTIYMRPNSQWKMNSARFAAYFFTGSSEGTWVSMTDSDGDSYFEATVPNGKFTSVIFCRMNPAFADNAWSTESEDRVWNQTADLNYDGKNDCFELTGGLWDGSGTWSVYAEKLVYFVNTKAWKEVSAYCTNTSLAGDIWPGDPCTLVDAELSVYSVYPGLYPRIIFTDNTSDGEYTSTYNYNDVMGKYIEPITGGVYNSAQEAWNAVSNNVDENLVYFVNTLGWADVAGYGWTDGIGSNTAWPGKAATLVDAKNQVYSYDPGNRVKVLFNDNTEYGSYTSYYTCADVKGKFIEPKTGGVYSSATEAWNAANSQGNPADTATVTIAGTFNEWSKTATPLTATSSDVVSTTVELEGGKYYFKIVHDNYWYGSGSSFVDKTDGLALTISDGDCVLNATGGTYTFNYNVTSHALNVTAVIAKDPAETASVTISGTFNNWSKTANPLTYSSKNIVSTTLELSAGTYKFKIVDGIYWYGNGGIIKDSTEATSATGWEMTIENSANCTLIATGGKYTFNYNVVSKTIEVLAELNDVDPATVATVTISGGFNDWSKTANPLTYSAENTVSTTIELEAGNYHFKIIEDGLWYGSGSSIFDVTDNTSLTIVDGDCILNATGGKYTFNYNVVTDSLKITAELTGDPAEAASVYVAGGFNSWDKTANKLTYSGENTVSTTMDIAKGTYKFKIVDGVHWYGNDGVIADSTTVTSSTGWVMSIDAGNCTLQATGGSYTFSYNVVTKALVITAEVSSDPAETAVVSIAGTFNSWSKTANPLTYSAENTVSTTMELAAGTYSFKIVDDSLWYGNGLTFTDVISNSTLTIADGDCVLNATGGKYTFNYNVVTKALNIVSEVSTDPAETAVVSIAGEFNGWSKTANALTYSGDNTVSTTITLEEGTYKFKVVHDNYWYGNNGTIVDTTTATSAIGWEMSITAGDCALQATGGSYTFTYNVTTRMLTIVYNG